MSGNRVCYNNLMIAQLVLPLWALLYFFYLYSSLPGTFLVAAIVFGATFSARANRPVLPRLCAGILLVSLVNIGLLAPVFREFWDDPGFFVVLITAGILATPVLAALAWWRSRAGNQGA